MIAAARVARLTHGHRAGHPPSVDTDPLEGFSDAERAWVLDNERLWQRAHAIVAAQPHLDVSLVYHSLVNLRRTPSERLARGLDAMDPFALSEPERALLREPRARGVRFAVIGMGAAVLQGATTMTQGLNLWFERLSDPQIGDGEPVKLLSLERILASKRAANRPKDIAQIPVLEAAIAARDAETLATR